MTDIGEKLRSAREAMGLSIADVEKTTKIQSRYLTAIENDEFDKLPGDFYTRAFIRQYAQVVGLDGKELLSEFHQDVPESKPDEYVEDSVDNKTEEVQKTTNNRKKQLQKYLPRLGIAAGVIIVLIIIYIVGVRAFSGGGNQSQSTDNVAVSSESSKSSSKKPANTVKITSEGNGVYRVSGLKSNRDLDVTAGDQSTFVQISFDGNVKYAETLDSGDTHKIKVPKDVNRVTVKFDNAMGTKVTIGGKKVPYNATDGQKSIQLLFGSADKQKSATTSSSDNVANNTDTTQNNNNNYAQNTQQGNQQTNNNQVQTRQSQQQVQPQRQPQSQQSQQSQVQQSQQQVQQQQPVQNQAQNNGGKQ